MTQDTGRGAGALSLEECVRECCKTPELVSEFNRLSGRSVLVDKRPPIVRMVDKATGFDKEKERRQNEDM